MRDDNVISLDAVKRASTNRCNTTHSHLDLYKDFYLAPPEPQRGERCAQIYGLHDGQMFWIGPWDSKHPDAEVILRKHIKKHMQPWMSKEKMADFIVSKLLHSANYTFDKIGTSTVRWHMRCRRRRVLVRVWTNYFNFSTLYAVCPQCGHAKKIR